MFDGVHLGHLDVIKTLKKISDERGYVSGVFSFYPHPRKFLNPKLEINYLTTVEEKTDFLAKEKLDMLFLQEFDKDFRCLEAEEFVEKILVKKLNVQYLILGYDHRFGKDKKGDFELLNKLGKKWGFELEQLKAISFEKEEISSTKIRKALTEGNVKIANQMLGYSYSVSGKIVHGKKIGRTIGFPTANIEVHKEKLLPKKGAYIVEVWLRGKFYKGMLSVGTNPTVGGNKMSVEVYILDFHRDIYGEYIEVKFRDFLHEEIKFESIEKLMERLDEDKKLTENYNYFL